MFLQVVRNQFVLFASMLYFSIAKATTMFIRGGVGIKKSNKKVEFFYKDAQMYVHQLVRLSNGDQEVMGSTPTFHSGI